MSTETPYRAPSAGAAPLEPLYQFHGTYFVVDEHKKVPPVCLKCASRKDIHRRDEALGIGKAAGSGASVGALSGVFGAAIASFLRSQPELRTPVLLGALVLIAVTIGIAVKVTQRVQLSLPLCQACFDRWESGVRARGMALAIVLGGLAAVVLGLIVEEPVITGLGAVPMFGALIWIAALKLPQRFVAVVGKVDTRVHLHGVGAGVPAAIEQRKREKEAKSARKTGGAAASTVTDTADGESETDEQAQSE